MPNLNLIIMLLTIFKKCLFTDMQFIKRNTLYKMPLHTLHIKYIDENNTRYIQLSYV